MSANFLVLGSKTPTWRPPLSTGKSFADGCSEPFLQKAGLAGGRIRVVIQTRPRASNIGLWTEAWLFQIRSVPQSGEGASISVSDLAIIMVSGVFGSRTGTFTSVALWRTGSRTG